MDVLRLRFDLGIGRRIECSAADRVLSRPQRLLDVVAVVGHESGELLSYS